MITDAFRLCHPNSFLKYLLFDKLFYITIIVASSTHLFLYFLLLGFSFVIRKHFLGWDTWNQCDS